MKKFFKKVTTIALVMAMALSLGTVKQSEAKTKMSPKASIKGIKVLNPEDFQDISLNNKKIKIEYKVLFKDNCGLSKKEKKDSSKVTFETNNKNIVQVDKNGVASGFTTAGKAKIVVRSKVNKKIKTEINVEVTTDRDMVFKYSNLYFVIPSVPMEINLGDKDALGHEFGIKTNFNATLSDFVFTSYDAINESEISSKATVDRKNKVIVVKDYGITDIECSYLEEPEVGDSFNLYILTQEQFDTMKQAGEILDEKENTFDDDEEEDDPNEVEDTDESEDEFTKDD